MLFCAAAAVAGCSMSHDPGPGSPSYEAGQLGNGGFAFECDDSVACDRYTDTAQEFPDAIALGSTFRVRYIPKDDDDGKGVTVGPVSTKYVTYAAKGLAAIGAGYATIAAQDASGKLVDFITVTVRKPDALVVYDASYVGSTPARITTVKLQLGDVTSLRALARAKTGDLAGTLAYEWTSPSDGVVDVRSEASGKVTLTALEVGTTKLTVSGGAFEEAIEVEVTP